ncbi:hypothetical protein CQ12_10450 [Bradyrhizobium jicamae]|uniref:Uncharacterized protein n=1 Tax=Bradyrhizobium jicamae TaxID=280332 RepID=A0A0R3LR71_9BRAD|nr:hypothetical protein [Bradyrhizobium jicamae]KRR10471.1 hypothetical protein CQ12_10450 [Bradyrhizobium jicamae]
MRNAAIPVVVGIALASGIAWAQGAEDPAAQLRDCGPMEGSERPECPDKASPTAAPVQQSVSKGDSWILSQTTSPVDYSPVATATTLSQDGAIESAMKLSVRCRKGQTELVVAGPGISGRGNDYAISYRINDGQPVQIAAAPPASGAGVAFGGDVIRLLQSLPDAGSLSVHLAHRTGAAVDGTFSLGGWEAVRTKMIVACKWSHPAAKPNG